MHRVGVILIWISLFACVFGLIFGIMDLLKYGEPSIWMAMIPAGFLGLLTGTVMTLFSKP